jgi:hypothetical protein
MCIFAYNLTLKLVLMKTKVLFTKKPSSNNNGKARPLKLKRVSAKEIENSRSKAYSYLFT